MTDAPVTPLRRRLIVGFCCLSVLVISIDATIVNVGLPSIQHALHASVSGLQWVAAAYTLVLASLLMLTGSLADRFGRRKVFQTGMVLFSLGSLLCSIAPNLWTLIVARVIQAMGASALNPVALAIITNAIPDRRERAAAAGIWSGVAGLGLALGPICGGALIAAAGWRSIFWFNVPFGIVAIIGLQLVAPESRAQKPRSMDLPGQVLMIGLIGGLTAAIIEGERSGWGSTIALALFAVAILSGIGFVTTERHTSQPMLELRFFRSAPFTGATINALAAFISLGGFLFLNTLYLQDARGYSALHAGLLTAPLAFSMAVLAPLSGRIVGARGARLPFLIAGVCGIIAPLLLVGLRLNEPMWQLMLSYVLFGVSMGMVNAPIATTAVSGMPRDQTGVAASVASTGRQVGNALGVAITGAFVAGGAGAKIASSSHTAWLILSACGAVVLISGYISTGRWARSTTLDFDASESPSREAPNQSPVRV